MIFGVVMKTVKVNSGRKNFVPTIVAIIIVMLVVAAIISFIILFQPKPREVNGKLKTPDNLTVKKAETQEGFQYFVSYNPVEGADSYLIHINDEYTHQSTSTVVDITKFLNVPKEYTISVQAVNNRISSYNSDLSTIQYLNTLKLNTPKVTRTNEIFLWSAVNNANAYNVELKYGTTTKEYQLETSSFDITSILNLTQNDPTVTNFSLRVQAVYLGTLLWENSDFSSEVEYVIVKNLEDMFATHFTTERIENENLTLRHKISWTNCFGADTYEIYLSKSGGNYAKVGEVAGENELTFDLTDYLNGVGTYTAYIKAISNNEYTLSSQSNYVDFLVSRQIATPTILDAQVNGEYMSVSWQAGDQEGLETCYYLVVSDSTNVVYDAVVVGTNYDFLLTVNRSGFYKITVVAKNQIDSLLYTDSKPSLPFEKTVVSKLSAPSGISFVQEKADNVATLSWSVVENASGYVVQLYTKDGDEYVEYADPIYVTSTSINLPINTAGYYFAKVKTLASEGFYTESDFSLFVNCTYKTSLIAPTNFVLNSDTLIATWNASSNASSYEIYINSQKVEEIAFTEIDGVVTLTNLATIFEDTAKYPSNATVPYVISVKAVGEIGGLYADSAFASVEYLLTRKLFSPTNLLYEQKPNTNNVKLSWDTVENATDGYSVYINGTAPVDLQYVLTTSVEIGSYLLPGKNNIQVVANKCLNYDASDFATFENDPEFIYYMQPASNVRINSNVENGNTTYSLSFDTHKYANYYMFTFYSDEALTQQVGRHIETVYYTNGATVSFSVNFDWIKRTGDCITYIQVLSSYETGFLGSQASNFDAGYIVGDGQNLAYSKSATKVETYENETLLLVVSNEKITNKTSNSVEIEFEYSTNAINLLKVASFELVLITIDPVNGNSYSVPCYVDPASKTLSSNLGYYKFGYKFSDVGVGQYQIRIRALSANAQKVAHSGFVYLSFAMSITQETPNNLTIYRSDEAETYGNVIMQWDAISNVSTTSPATYTAKLFAFDENDNSSTLIQEWTSVGYANKVIIRNGQSVRVVTINLSLSRSVLDPKQVVESFMKSGLYYITVKANAISEYYLESAEATMQRANYYQHDASLTPPTISIMDGNVFIPYVDMVYYQLYYYTTLQENLTAMENLNYSLTLYNDVKSVRFNVASYFNSGFLVGTYNIVAVAKRDIIVNDETTTITSLKSNVVSYAVTYKFDTTTIENIAFSYVLDNTQNKYVSSLTTTFDMVEAQSTSGQTIFATDYQITLSNSKSAFNKKFAICFDENSGKFSIKVYSGDTFVSYGQTSFENGVYSFVINDVKTFEIAVVSDNAKMQFTMFNLDYLTSGLTYIYSIKTLGDESKFYGDSEIEAYSTFTYKEMWQTPTVCFADDSNADLTKTYLELSNGQGFSLHINPLVGSNTTYGGNWLFDVVATNLQTNTALGFYSVSGANVAGVSGRIYKANSTITPTAGIYAIKVRIVNSLKVESLWSEPLFVYYSLKNLEPKITKVAKAQTFSLGGDVNDIALEWQYAGFDGVDNNNLSFTLSIIETDEGGNPTTLGYSDTVVILKSNTVYENGQYSAVVELSTLSNGTNFFWAKTWGEETPTHYTFKLVANEYETAISAVLQQLEDDGINVGAITPTSAKYNSTNKTYVFNENSDAVGYLIRRDNALNIPTNFELVVENDSKFITWENVSDPSGQDYLVGYKYVYYTVDYQGNYVLHTNNAENSFEITFSGGTVLKKSDNSEISFLTNQENFWFNTNVNQFAISVTSSTIFGIWMFANPISPSSNSNASATTFQLVSYASTVELPTEMLWEVSTDNSQHSIYFENLASAQFSNANVNTYKNLYTISVGGHTIDWVADASSLGAITADEYSFKATITGLYNQGLINENVDENGQIISRQYQFDILANNFYMNVFNPQESENGYRASALLYQTNSVSGVVYRPIIIDRTVASATITSTDGKYYASFTEIPSATKYELMFVTTSNTPLGQDPKYFMNGTVPNNYVEKLLVEINQNDERCTWTESGKTQVGYISVSGEGLRTISVDISALLNGRPAATYYLAIYTLPDSERHITTNGSATTASASFVYHKTYQAIDEESILFTTDEEGLLKTISWAENANPDGGWVHDGAYYRLTIWDSEYEGENPPYYALDGSGNTFANFSISTQSGVSSIVNLYDSEFFSFENTDVLGARMVADVETLFKNYLRFNGVRKAGNYTIALQIFPVNSTMSSYEPSLITTKSFVYKVKLELLENEDYVNVMVDDCLDKTIAETTHEIVFENDKQSKAEQYLQNGIIAGNFNLKSLYVNSWLSSMQSVALEVLMQNSNGNWVVVGQIEDVLTNKLMLLTGTNNLSLVAGQNKIAIRALGVNENYITSELKYINFDVYYKHATPTISVDGANTIYVDDGNTLSYISLKLDNVNAQNYDVVVSAYRIVDGEKVLTFTTPTDSQNRLVWAGQEGRFVYKNTYNVEEKRNQSVNFLDFFTQNAGTLYGNSSFDHYTMYSLIGAYEYVFTARIFASEDEKFMLNGDESAYSDSLTYSYKLSSPTFSTTTGENGGSVNEWVERDADQQITSAAIKIRLDRPNFKTIVNYSVSIWDLNSNGTRYVGNDNDTMTYTASVQMYYNTLNQLSYSIVAVTYNNASGIVNNVASSVYENYFKIEDDYLIFDLMLFIKGDARENAYLAGVYHYNVRANSASNYYDTGLQYVLSTNTNIKASEYAYEFEIENDNEKYAKFYEYIHTVPYPVLPESVVVDTNGVLSFSFKDVYKTAMGFDITVNDQKTTLSLENANENTQQIYTRDISSLLVVGKPNVVKLNVQEIGYYSAGKEIEATLDFSIWSHEILTIRNLMWNAVSGTHLLNFDAEIFEIYLNDERLQQNDQKADLVHFGLEISYLSNFDASSISGLYGQEAFEVFNQTAGVEKISIKNLSVLDVLSFVPQMRTSYSFDLNKCIAKIDESWLVSGSLRGGYYSVKLYATLKNEDGTTKEGTEYYLDTNSYISLRYILSPWQLTNNIDLWDEMGGIATKTTQTATEQQKLMWAENTSAKWGVVFDVASIKGVYPTEYKVYYVRDTRELAFDETYSFVVRGDNVSYEDGKAWLNFMPYFNSTIVPLAGVYSFIIKALNVQDVAEESAYIAFASETGKSIIGDAVLSYSNFGLQHFVKLATPILGDNLINSEAQSATIRIVSNLLVLENEEDLVEEYQLTNFRGENFVDGQEYPTDAVNTGTGLILASGSFATYVYHDRTNSSLGLKYGNNFVSVKSKATGNLSDYYLTSNNSNLKCYNWEITLDAPTSVDVSLKQFTDGYQDIWQGKNLRTVPENDDVTANESRSSGIHGNTQSPSYLQNVGGVRSQSATFDAENEIVYQDYFVVSAQVSIRTSVIDGITRLELRVFDPVTNINQNYNQAIAHIIVRADMETGEVYFESMAEIGVNAFNGNMMDMGNTVVGNCQVVGDMLNIYVTNLKVYQLFPTVTYDKIMVYGSEYDPDYMEQFSGVKNFASIPQTYTFLINSISNNIASVPTEVKYDYSLRFITPEIAENGIVFSGNAIASDADGSVYIKDGVFVNGKDDYVVSINVNKISRNTKYIKLYAYVDSVGIKNYYSDSENVYFANFDETYAKLNSLSYNFKMFDITKLVTFESETSAYGSATLTIDANDNIWSFINKNTPNVIAFHVQAVTEAGATADAAYSFTEHEGDLYAIVQNSTTTVLPMTLRYSESYVSKKAIYTIKRQFVPAPIDLRFDVGQVYDGGIVTSLKDNAQSELKNNIKTNLHVTNGIALDPYLMVDENSYSSTITYKQGSANSRASSLDYEYTETQKYGGYEIKITTDTKSSDVLTFKTSVTETDGVIENYLGLFQTVEKFDAIAKDNKARYIFENNVFKNISILDDYCLYNLIASVFENGQGGNCTINIRAIAGDNEKWIENSAVTDLKPNLWVSQDDTNWTQMDFVFYTRPDAVKLTLGQAVFDSSNPLAVRWGNETSENELLYPNNVPLSWTNSSTNFGSYTLDITRAEETTLQYQAQGGFKYSQNQGTNNFLSTSVNLVSPNFNFANAENTNYNTDKNTYARFNYWDYMNGTTSARIPNAVVPYYNIVVQANGNKNLFVGKGYRSGANDEGLLNDVTNYYVQLKYNMGTFATKSTVTTKTNSDANILTGYEISNLSTFSFTTKNNSGTSTTVTLADEEKNLKTYNFVNRTYVTLTGPFSFVKDQNGAYTSTNKTTDLLYSSDGWQNTQNYIEGFSVTGLKGAILEYLRHVNAVGGKYTFQLHFSGGEQDEDQSKNTVAYVDSDESNIFEFEYFREVEDGELLIEDLSTFDNSEAQLDLPVYGLKFTPKKNLENYEKFIGEYSIVMEQKVVGTNGIAASAPKTSGTIASFVAYDSVGEAEQKNGVLSTAYSYQEFNDKNADAMDNNKIGEDEVTNYTQNGYTRHLGSLQGGVNSYIYTITAGDTKYNLPFKKRVKFTYSIPNAYIPSISTSVSNVYSYVANLNVELEDYYENVASQTVSIGDDGDVKFATKNPASAFNFDLYYTKHTALMTGFINKATVLYDNAYEIDWSFTYSTISIQQATLTTAKDFPYSVYKINKFENQKPMISVGSTVTIAGKSDIVYSNAKDIASDASGENKFVIDFAKNNKTVKAPAASTDTKAATERQATTPAEQLYAYKVENFTFTVKAKPGFASVFTTTAENGWSKDKDNKAIEGTVTKTFDNYSAKITETHSKKIKYATINVQATSKIGSTTHYTPTSWSDVDADEQAVISNKSPMLAHSIGGSTNVSYKQRLSLSITYSALSAFNYNIASINYNSDVFQQSTWTYEKRDLWGVLSDSSNHVHEDDRDRTLSVTLSLQDLLLNNIKISKNVTSEAINLRNRPTNYEDGIGGNNQYRFKNEMAYLSISKREVVFSLVKTGDTTIPKSNETDANYIPLLHEQMGLVAKFGFTKAENVAEKEAEKCKTCNGTTYVKCTNCSGNGIIGSGSMANFCPICSGTGNMSCPDCNAGYVNVCDTCKGLTKLVCQRCGGDGVISFKRAFKTYWENGEEKNVPTHVVKRLDEVMFVEENDRLVGCPDCGGTGTFCNTDNNPSQSVYKYLYYDVDSGKLLKGEQTNKEAGRTKQITAGTGVVDCYACSGGKNQTGLYNEDGSLKTANNTSGNTSSGGESAPEKTDTTETKTASLAYCAGCCGNVGFVNNDCSCGENANSQFAAENDCNDNIVSIKPNEKGQTLIETQNLSATMQSLVDLQVQNDGQKPKQQKTPLQNAESVLLQAAFNKNELCVCVDSNATIESGCA